MTEIFSAERIDPSDLDQRQREALSEKLVHRARHPGIVALSRLLDINFRTPPAVGIDELDKVVAV